MRILTSLQSHRRVRAIDAVVLLRRAAHGVVRVHESIRHRTIVRHSEVVNTLAQAVLIRWCLRRAAHVPLKRDFRGPFDLVVDALARILEPVEGEVVEERRDRVLWDPGVRELRYLELLGAAV